MTTFRLQAGTTATLAALLLTGCMDGPKYQKPPAIAQAPPAAYKESPTAADAGTWKVAQPQDAVLHGNWWEIYSDPELNQLEEKLNIDNQDIKVYFANFMEARTLISQRSEEHTSELQS